MILKPQPQFNKQSLLDSAVVSKSSQGTHLFGCFVLLRITAETY